MTIIVAVAIVLAIVAPYALPELAEGTEDTSMSGLVASAVGRGLEGASVASTSVTVFPALFSGSDDWFSTIICLNVFAMQSNYSVGEYTRCIIYQ